jgi:hypothetical protein
MMSPEMTSVRFAALAEAYGGEIARWPEGEREAARALLASHPEALAQVLADAAQLDRLLDLAPAQAPTAALLGRLIVDAPQPAKAVRRWVAAVGAVLGLSAAAFAGVLAGVALGGHVVPLQAPGHAPARVETVTAVDVSNDLQDALEEPNAL